MIRKVARSAAIVLIPTVLGAAALLALSLLSAHEPAGEWSWGNTGWLLIASYVFGIVVVGAWLLVRLAASWGRPGLLLLVSIVALLTLSWTQGDRVDPRGLLPVNVTQMLGMGGRCPWGSPIDREQRRQLADCLRDARREGRDDFELWASWAAWLLLGAIAVAAITVRKRTDKEANDGPSRP